MCCLWRSGTGPTFISSSPSAHRHTVPDSCGENNFLFIPAGSAKPLWLGRNELTLLARASSAELFYIASLTAIQPNPVLATEHPLLHCLTCETIATRSVCEEKQIYKSLDRVLRLQISFCSFARHFYPLQMKSSGI